MRLLVSIPLTTILIFCATIGLAPFTPPHVWEKLQMLVAGTLSEPIDILDLVMHGAPWLVLIVKLARLVQRRVTA
ncbi:MAG: RND transporter [Maritimibacter sp.]|uniref:RND transporter n=1 Tax=Maritimibacter sp. TaxID=2003363 RepID=UPI001E15AD31|nr:RND transporter [Maritimibacter sp.]MBL6429702.1 RND transporter [Maritimibacter sp.]